MLSKEQIRELAQKFAIDEFSVIREYLQILFLSELYEQKESSKIYFKGGTALRLLLNSFRFSEDLDFTSLRTPDELKKILARVIRGINLIVPAAELRQVKTNINSLTGFLKYKTDEMKFPLNIHLEFSLREKPLTEKDIVLETLFPVSPYPVIKCLSWEEVLAEKIRALMHRAKGRDLFDIWYLLSKGTEIDWIMTDKKMSFYKEKVTREDVFSKISVFDQKILKLDLGKFLPLSQRKIAVHIKEMLMEKLK
ncbi:MAG: nucleotidyl transferase AbiEii/AbiGii toxin family protein [Nitrospirae bacterium]|nr:nucleotidyl transferase AbiEii/AbiGii toxin family protein [Nitrospirota bacterium]